MRVVLCRRVGEKYEKIGGGYYNAGALYAKYLEGVPGLDLESTSVRQPDLSGIGRPDLLWVFGFPGDPSPFIEAAKAWKCPVVVTSEFNNSSKRSRRIQQWAAKWLTSPEVFLHVFSNSALYNPALVPHRDRIAVFPHPFAIWEGAVPDFDARQGVCVGDIGKLSESHRTLVNPNEVVQELHARGIPVTGYRQYRVYSKLPPEMKIVPYLHEGFQEFLGTFRVFVNFIRHETFGMVPMEALSIGTPVVYPFMPQSLSEALGPAGFCYRDAKDLVESVEALYHDRLTWEGMSRSGKATADAHRHLMVPQLLRAFRSICGAYKPCE